MDPEIDVEQARAPIAARDFVSYGATELRKTPDSMQSGGTEGSKLTQEGKPASASHSYMYSMLRNHSHHNHAFYYRVLLRTLVAVSVVNVILEDTPFFQTHCTLYFNVFEAVASTLFLLEYLLKVWTAPEKQSLKKFSPDIGRLKWVVSCESAVDVLSWAPFFVEIFCGIPLGTNVLLSLLRLVRLFKLPQLWFSFRLVARVIWYNHTILGQAFLLCSLMTLACSIALYYTRPESDPLDNFSSILACMYLAILMLTGQGEPNGVMPWDTRVIISVTALFAIAQFAIPAAMLTWGFEQEAERNIAKRYEREQAMAKRQIAGTNAPCSSSSSCESDRESEWEGYVNQLLGSEDDSDSQTSSKKDDAAKALADRGQQILLMSRTVAKSLTMKETAQARRIFIKLDTDNDGFLSWTHFRAITDSDQYAKDIMGQLASFKKVLGDDKVTVREFFIWLDQVKTGYKRYGGNVLQRMLDQMETGLAKQYAPAKARWKKAMIASKVGAMQPKTVATVAEAVAVVAVPAVPTSMQLMQYAEQMGEMERLNEVLRSKALVLEQEIAHLKATKN